MTPRTTTLPCWSLSWGVVPASGLPRGRSREPAMRALLEVDLPAPHERFHIAWARRADGNWVACALPLSQLTPLLEASPSAILCDALPAFVVGPDDDPEALRLRLNLVLGAPATSAARARRHRSRAFAAAAISLAWIVLLVGLERRAAHWRQEETRLRAREHEVIAAALGPGPGVPALRLQAALRRSPAPATRPQLDPARTLESLCRAWPLSGATVDRFSADPSGATLVTLTPDLSVATHLAQALALPGLAPPARQLAAASGGVRLTLRWQPPGENSGAKP